MSAPLSNYRHERFAQELAKGVVVSKAYVKAGYKDSPASATRLSKQVNILDRISQLQGKAADRAEVTVESLIREAEEARVLAMSTKQPNAAVAAIKEKGVLAGVRVEKRENTNRDVDPDRLTDAELAALIAATQREIAEYGDAAAPSSALTH